MPADLTDIELPVPPTEDELRAAYLRRQDPRALALMMTPSPALQRAGETLFTRSGEQNRALLEARQRFFSQRLQLAQERRLQEALQQDAWGTYVDPWTGVPVMFNRKTGEQRSGSPDAPPALPTPPERLGVQPVPEAGEAPRQPPPTRYGKPLTETQGQAAMFLSQAAANLHFAQAMGKSVLPAPGWSGLAESVAWQARSRGFPQLASEQEQKRQSVLLAIAEPIVRAESGAAVPEEEVRRLALRYIPMPGEAPPVQVSKLRMLISAVGGVMQRLPPVKAQEFAPFYDALAGWAAQLEQEVSPGPKPAITRPGAATPPIPAPQAESQSNKQPERARSKSGRPMVKVNGQWMYED